MSDEVSECDACGEPLNDDGQCPRVSSMVDEIMAEFGETTNHASTSSDQS